MADLIIRNAGMVLAGDLAQPIVHADTAQGLFVCCKDGQLLRINVIKLPEGIYSGGKLAALGFRTQQRFTNNPQSSTNFFSVTN